MGRFGGGGGGELEILEQVEAKPPSPFMEADQDKK